MRTRCLLCVHPIFLKQEKCVKGYIYAMAAAFTMIFCFSGMADANTYTPDEMFVVSGFTVEITSTGCGSDINSTWATGKGGSPNTATARSRYRSHGVKSPALGRTALPSSLLSSQRHPRSTRQIQQVHWKSMRGKALIRGKRMFLLSTGGKKQLAPTGIYKLNNGKRVAVRNGRILPKASCP